MSRDKPVLRAIKLLTLIERHPNGLRVADMAEQLDAPPRAIYRDLQVLESLPLPLFTDKSGKESYWKVDPDFQSRLTIPFTLSELLSVYLARDAIRPLDGTVLSDSLQSLFEKVWALLPKPLFRQMVELRALFFPAYRRKRGIGPIGNSSRSSKAPFRNEKLYGSNISREITTRPSAASTPYAVHLYNGTLYMIGYCHTRKDIRTFVVDRMQKIKMTDDSFPAPLGFSLVKYLRHSFGMFREELVRVKVCFHKSLTRYLLERRWHPSQKNKKLKDGSLELSFEVAGTKEIKTWIMGFGSLAKVIEPPSLVQEVKDDLGKALKSYAKR